MSEVAASPSLSEEKQSELVGIGGWLLLPALSMVVSPIRIAYDFYQGAFQLLKPSTFFALLSTKSTFYNPPFALLLGWEILANLFLFAYTIWLAFLFFKKQKSVPKLYIGWLALICTLQIIDLLFSSMVPIVRSELGAAHISALIKSMFAAAIWIPYFLKSKRVKNTFVSEKEIKWPGSNSL